MALTDLQRLRLTVADRTRLIVNETLGIGDGAARTFQTQMAPVVEAAVRVGGSVQDEDTDYTLDTDLGRIVFTVAPADGAEIVSTYLWTVFSDAELEDALTRNGSVNQAAIEALRWLLADSERFIKYTHGYETVDRSEARKAIENLIDRLEAQAGAPAGVVKATSGAEEALLAPFLDATREWSVDAG